MFRIRVPAELAGHPLRPADVPGTTGCHVVGIVRDGTSTAAVSLDEPIPADADLLLVGAVAAEGRFYARYVTRVDGRGVRGWVRRRRSREPQ